MPYFVTDYTLTDGLTGQRHRYGSGFFARDDDANRVRRLRGIGEQLQSRGGRACRINHPRLTELAGRTDAKLERNLPQILHGAVFASWIAVRSGRLDTDDVLGDLGVIHELIHRLRFGRPWANGSDDGGNTHERLLALLTQLEAATPEMWWPEESEHD